MTPTPQEHAASELDINAPTADGDRIVISGVSGLYPDSHHVKDLADILYNKRNPVSSDNIRWQYNHPEVAQHSGNIPELERFDAQFFKVHFRLGHSMDPMSRKVLEQAYNAIYDAGINPQQLSGKKIGVFIGSCFSEAEKVCFYDATSRSGFGITGCCKAMFANRISYWLNAKGPSMSIDEACCSSAAALEQAYMSMSRGDCEGAIVGGCYLCMHPQSSVHYGRIMKQSRDGKTRSFDEKADGSVKSEAINVLFLQKAKDALRVYASLVHAKTEFIGVLEGETGPQYGFLRNPDASVNFLKKFYEEARVPPQAVEYVEAFGSAVPEADKAELEAIDTVFCKEKDDTLLVGSVISNIGYCEAASGVSGITKVLLGFHTGRMAANLHCENPRQDVDGIRDGRIKILTDHQRFNRSYAAVNGMSVTGMNSHILLHGHFKPKDVSRYKSDIPHLVTLSARQDTGVKKIIENLKSRPIDPEELALLHNIHQSNIAGHLGRGFVILGTNEEQTISLAEKVEYFDDARRPLWFVYSGMGSQWAGMGAQLMRIPIFAAAIEKCRRVLEPKGIDIVHIITTDDVKIFDNILHSFVGIAAIQIGLTDILRELGMVPDGIIGHSVGELGCAYADGCLTAEEMILSAYSRGLVSLQTPFIRGSMAAIGLGYEKISQMIPPEIEVACHNGPDSSTISGPSDIMRDFVAELTAKEIFAKEVPCSNIAYHSRYIADAGPGLLKYLKEVIRTPKQRSERWVSTSVPKDKWHEDVAQYSSAEYHTNNLLCPVLFEETLPEVPRNAVLIEVAPHGLLQAILKRSLPSDCKSIALTRRNHSDNIFLFLEAVGKLYMEGYNPKVQILYPKIEMPVSTGTPFLSHHVEWAHGELWALPLYKSAARQFSTTCNWVISQHDMEHQYLEGCVIKGKLVYSFAAILVAVWDTLAMIMNVPKKELSVEFRDIHLHAEPVLYDQSNLRLSIQILRGNGYFEVLEGDIKIALGYVVSIKSKEVGKQTSSVDENDDTDAGFTIADIYSLLQDRGYSYSGQFKSIERVNPSFSKAELYWRNNWVTLIDSILQLNVLRQNHDSVSKIKYVRRMNIDTDKHRQSILDVTGHKTVLKAEIDTKYKFTRCGGIFIEDIRYYNLPVTSENKIELETLQLVKNGRDNLNRIMVKNENNNLFLDELPEIDLAFGVVNKSNWGGEYYLPVQESISSNNVMLKLAQIGDIDSFYWTEAPEVKKDKIIVDVHYTGISNVDVKRANGTVNFENNAENCFGMDFSGTTLSGERVMGIVLNGAARSRVSVEPELVWPVPEHWTLEEAATVPLAYIHALYCLGMKRNIVGDLSVLIHGGCGAVGQAVIALALSIGCEVFTTVSDIHKKKFLLKMFPELKASHIGYSRDITFADMVLQETKGIGCYCVILTDMSQNLKDASCKCTAMSGHVIDLSQLQSQDTYSFGMNYLTLERTYSIINLNSIFKTENRDQLRKLQVMLSDNIARGYVRPLSRVTYEPQEVSRAFCLLAASRHRGRVLLHIKQNTPRVHINRIYCDANQCQLLLFDDETFGLHLADRLVKRGAKKLHLQHSFNASEKLQLKIRLWQTSGIQVQTSSVNLYSANDIAGLLNDAQKLGAIQGIYYIVGAEQNIHESLFSILDSKSRQLCPSLNYFAIINMGDSMSGHSTCISRVHNNLPATMLSLGEINNKTNASWRDALDALERALRVSPGVMRARAFPESKRPILEQIASIAKIKISEDTLKTITLEELGVPDDKLNSIAALLRVRYNVSLKETDVLHLSLDTLLKLDTSDITFEDVKGLETFISGVDSDELIATTEMVIMPTITSGASLRDDEFDISESYLCIVPGIEGHHERFRGMCERLKLPAVVFQPGLDHIHETVRGTAERFVKSLTKRTGIKNNFYLVGYESGVLVSLEMAKILEEQGLSGTVYCIGHAPDELNMMIQEKLSDYKTEEDLQDAVIRHMFKLMAGKDMIGLGKALQNATSWDQKVDICVRFLKGHVPHSVQYASALIKAALARIKQARQYNDAAHQLGSRVVLLRAATTHAAPSATTLQQYSQQPVLVHHLRAPLAHAANDARCAAIINQYLDPEILVNFDKKNICDSYLLNPYSFMTAEQ